MTVPLCDTVLAYCVEYITDQNVLLHCCSMYNNLDFSTLRMKYFHSSEMTEDIYKPTWRDI